MPCFHLFYLIDYFAQIYDLKKIIKKICKKKFVMHISKYRKTRSLVAPFRRDGILPSLVEGSGVGLLLRRDDILPYTKVGWAGLPSCHSDDRREEESPFTNPIKKGISPPTDRLIPYIQTSSPLWRGRGRVLSFSLAEGSGSSTKDLRPTRCGC